MRTRLVAATMAAMLGAGGIAVVAPSGTEAKTKRFKAAYKLSPSKPRAGQAIRFRATGSCKNCRFRWDLRKSSKAKKKYSKMGTGRSLSYTFNSTGTKTVRLTVTRSGKKYRKSRRFKVSRAAAGSPVAKPQGNPLLAKPSCEAGAVNATSSGAVRQAVAANRNVCVTTDVGNVDLDGLKGSAPRFVGTQGGGKLGEIHLEGASNITFRARIGSFIIRGSDDITIERSIIGGTPNGRVLDQLIFIPETSNNVTIRDNEIAWTTADNSGNTGYGIRAYNTSANLRIERNYIHHIGGDAIQLGMDGPNTLVDRNEIAYVARPADSDEHSDDLQVIGNGPNMRITNNYMHDNGQFDKGVSYGGSSGPYIHAGDSATMLFENNLVRDAGNFMQVGDLGTGGCEKSNLTFRRNTFFHNGNLFGNGPDFQWSICGGSGNVFERNVVNNLMFNKFGFGSATADRDNLIGAQYTIDDAGTCTVGACNPSGKEPIGYRKPSGVHW